MSAVGASVPRVRQSSHMSAGSLFDAPGPRGRRVVLVVTIASVLLIVAAIAAAVHRLSVTGQLDASRWQLFGEPAIRLYLLKALGRTLLAAGGAALIGLPLGVVLAVMRLSRNRIVHVLGVCLVEFFRAVPLLLIIYIFFFALPKYGINPDLFWKLTIPIGLCAGATLAEVFRAGVLAVPHGQREAAAAIGLLEGQTFRIVLFPQAVRLVVPSIVAQVVILLKDTTLGYAVSYSELQNSAQLLTAIQPLSLVQTYFVVSVVYVLINVAISQAASYLDRRWQAGRHTDRFATIQ
ncbi:MAG: amino acid ABC transporter permease [Propionibacteriaceae bacterium]|nr:amino acid ABC transporter permease [Propionibacteriaceae bacterium]